VTSNAGSGAATRRKWLDFASHLAAPPAPQMGRAAPAQMARRSRASAGPVARQGARPAASQVARPVGSQLARAARSHVARRSPSHVAGPVAPQGLRLRLAGLSAARDGSGCGHGVVAVNGVAAAEAAVREAEGRAPCERSEPHAKAPAEPLASAQREPPANAVSPLRAVRAPCEGAARADAPGGRHLHAARACHLPGPARPFAHEVSHLRAERA
jgi:hypothetical protein